MKRRILMVALCMMLIVSTVLAPVSASASTVKIMKVNVEGARMRKGSGLFINKPSLKKGERVFYAGKQYKAFYYVCTASGRKGYVYKRYLSSYGAVNSKQIFYTTGKTKIYKKPNSKSSRIGSIAKHRYIIVYEIRGNWAYIKTMSGKGGFVKISSLKRP